MRTVQVRPPSFPQVEPDRPLRPAAGQVWQVLCGDRDHWRLGLYSPAATGPEQIEQLEQHDCPELFWLLDGRLCLLVAKDRRLEQIELIVGQPVLVSAPHAGFCPDGPHTGRALVIERDAFDTRYDSPTGFVTGQTLTFDPLDPLDLNEPPGES